MTAGHGGYARVISLFPVTSAGFQADIAGIDCRPGGFACYLFNEGSLEQLLNVGADYQGAVLGDTGVSYWRVYRQDDPQEGLNIYRDYTDYPFTDINDDEVVVDAIHYHGTHLFVAYHLPGGDEFWLADYAITGTAPEFSRVIEQLSEAPKALLAYHGEVYRVSDRQLSHGYSSVFSVGTGERIRSALARGNGFYLLLESESASRLQVVMIDPDLVEQRRFDTGMVPAEPDSFLSLKSVGNHLQLLTREHDQLRGQQYSLQGDVIGQYQFDLPEGTTLKQLELLTDPETGGQQLTAVGADNNNQPWWQTLGYSPVPSPVPSAGPILNGGGRTAGSFLIELTAAVVAGRLLY